MRVVSAPARPVAGRPGSIRRRTFVARHVASSLPGTRNWLVAQPRDVSWSRESAASL